MVIAYSSSSVDFLVKFFFGSYMSSVSWPSLTLPYNLSLAVEGFPSETSNPLCSIDGTDLDDKKASDVFGPPDSSSM